MKNRRTNHKAITIVAETILRALNVIAVFTLLLTIIGMIEQQNASGTALTLAIVSAAWLALMGIYTYIVNK